MKKYFVVVAAMSLALLLGCAPKEAAYKSKVPVEKSVTARPLEPRLDIPLEINLDVPFFPQAPDGDWSLPWQEACEEASAILAVSFAKGDRPAKDAFRKEILDLVEWEKVNFGAYEHTNVVQTDRMIGSALDYKSTRVIENPTVDELKRTLAVGHPIVAPFAGRLLKNPFYKGEGPYYHMLVIRGYDEKNFITNDVGTKRGENFIFPYETIMQAIHDWDPEDILKGGKRVIEIIPEGK